MRVTYFDFEPADCTSDPHPVSYGEMKTLKARLKVVFDDIIRVIESDMVQAVRSVQGQIGTIKYEADDYTNHRDKKRKQAKGPMAIKHKIAGLYWFSDPDLEHGDVHLPPGLTGVKLFSKLVQMKPAKFDSISIGVIWSFAGDASCSDYIQFGNTEWGDMQTVNYGSQDSWISLPGYKPWCRKMAKFLGKHFPIDELGKGRK